MMNDYSLNLLISVTEALHCVLAPLEQPEEKKNNLIADWCYEVSHDGIITEYVNGVEHLC